MTRTLYIRDKAIWLHVKKLARASDTSISQLVEHALRQAYKTTLESPTCSCGCTNIRV